MCAESQIICVDVPFDSIENGNELMITQISIKNFRCFERLEVSGLKRVNVIVGRNSSGKSAFLESIFLSSSSLAPKTAFQMRGIRKIGGNVNLPGDVSSYKGLWEDLFFNFDQEKRVSIRLTGSSGDSRSLMITYSDPGEQTLPFDQDLNLAAGGLPQIVFSWKRGSGPQIVVKPKFTQQGLTLEGSVVDFFQVIWYTSADLPEDGAKRFSDLSRDNRAHSVIDALKEEFPFIQDISIEYLSGVPMLFALVKGIAKRVPLGLVSEGVNRLFSILMGIASFRNGAILIDQIEDGFYHDRLTSIWKSIHRLAKTNNTQVFATTHSAECLKALLPTLEDSADEFALLRADRDRDDRVVFHKVEGQFLSAALDQGIDMR